MTVESAIAVVSGANRGLGFETCRQLARLGVQVVMTARDPDKGEQSAQSLQKEGLRVDFQPLDVTAEDSIRRLADHVRERFGRVDILINNAGVFPKRREEFGGQSSILTARREQLRQGMETNAYGALFLAQALIPMMQAQNYGRVVNVSSGMGQLNGMGGGYAAYRISKTALNAVTAILAAELAGANILVNSMCPGWVRTDMGGPKATRTPEQGVDTAVWLATLPDGGPRGGLFRDRKPIPW